MSEITMKKMRKWLKEKIKCDTEWMRHIETLDAFETDETSPSYSETEYNIKIMRAILAALERPPLEKSWMKLAEELNVPFSAVKIIRDKLYTEMEGPGAEEVLVDELQEDDLIPLTPGGLKSLKNPPAALEGPGVEERIELLSWLDSTPHLKYDGKPDPRYKKIRAFIMGKGEADAG